MNDIKKRIEAIQNTRLTLSITDIVDIIHYLDSVLEVEDFKEMFKFKDGNDHLLEEKFIPYCKQPRGYLGHLLGKLDIFNQDFLIRSTLIRILQDKRHHSKEKI